MIDPSGLPSPSLGSIRSLPILLLLIGVIVALLRFLQRSPSVKSVSSTTPAKVPLNPSADAAYLANCLRPDSSPLDILYAIATTPDNVAITQRSLELAEEVRAKKLAHLKQKETSTMEDLLTDDSGWAEEDEDDPAAAAARRAQEEKDKEAKQLARATGKEDLDKIKLEGLDEGVLGEKWVEKRLALMGQWPPKDLGDMKRKKFARVDAEAVSALKHPAIKRNLLMTTGRLFAKELNAHPDLLEAGPKGLIDPTYFQGTVEYRQRVGQQLEACLRMACTLRSFRLACSVLDATVMFKIGLVDVGDTNQLTWFKDLMIKQYGVSGTPKLIITDKYLGVPTPEPSLEEENKSEAVTGKAKKESEKNKIVQLIEQTKPVTTTDEKMALEIQVTRQHAESFTKEKVIQGQKQGIPPPIALQAYRECWFIMVRARKLDGELPLDDKNYGKDHMEFLSQQKHQLYEMLDASTISAFQNEFQTPHDKSENRLVVGWPFQIANVAQKSGKVKIHLPPPSVEGKYEFVVTVKSQDFLGVDDEFVLAVDIVKGVEKKKVDEKEENSLELDANDESKKNK